MCVCLCVCVCMCVCVAEPHTHTYTHIHTHQDAAGIAVSDQRRTLLICSKFEIIQGGLWNFWGWQNSNEQFQISPPNIRGGCFDRCRSLLIYSSIFVDRLLQLVCHDSASSLCDCTFPSNVCVAMAEQLCSYPCRNRFVRGKIWDHPSQTTQKWSKLWVMVILW